MGLGLGIGRALLLTSAGVGVAPSTSIGGNTPCSHAPPALASATPATKMAPPHLHEARSATQSPSRMRASPAERARRTERGAPLSAVTTASGQPRPRAAAACVGLGLGLAQGLGLILGSGVATQVPCAAVGRAERGCNPSCNPMYRACAAVGRAGGGAAPHGAVTGGGAGALARFRASRSRASAANSGAGTPWSVMCHVGGAVPRGR